MSLLNKIDSFFFKCLALINIFSRLPNDKDKISAIRGFLRLNFKGHLDKNTLLYNHSFAEISNILLDSLLKKIEEHFKESDTKILVVSHDLTLTGAPKAALMLVKSIKKIYQCAPMVLSIEEGQMRSEYEKEGLSVMLFSSLPSQKQDVETFFNQFDVVVINSLSWHILNITKYIKTPVIWWSHELFNTKKRIKRVKSFIKNIDLFLAGSPLVLDSLKQHVSLPKASNLLYGLDEIELPLVEKEDKVVFSLMGTVDKRKGTDIFVEAIKLLPDEVREKAVFNIIGDSGDAKVFKKIKKEVEKVKEIRLIPAVSFDKLLDFYSQSDVIVSTSRDDPMPIVVTYAFMFSKLCLVSNAIGTALLIKDGQDGVLFESENSKDLSQKIQDIIENKKDYKKITQNGYEIYKKHFSMQAFEKNVEYFVEMAKTQKKKDKCV